MDLKGKQGRSVLRSKGSGLRWAGRQACLDTASGRERGTGNALEAATNLHLCFCRLLPSIRKQVGDQTVLARFNGNLNSTGAPDPARG